MDASQHHHAPVHESAAEAVTTSGSDKESTATRKLQARRGIEDHMQRRKLEREFDAYFDHV